MSRRLYRRFLFFFGVPFGGVDPSGFLLFAITYIFSTFFMWTVVGWVPSPSISQTSRGIFWPVMAETSSNISMCSFGTLLRLTFNGLFLENQWHTQWTIWIIFKQFYKRLTLKFDATFVRQNGIEIWNQCSMFDLNEQCMSVSFIKRAKERKPEIIPFLYHAVQISFQMQNLNLSSPKDECVWSNSGGLATINSSKNEMCVKSGNLSGTLLHRSPNR